MLLVFIAVLKQRVLIVLVEFVRFARILTQEKRHQFLQLPIFLASSSLVVDANLEDGLAALGHGVLHVELLGQRVVDHRVPVDLRQVEIVVYEVLVSQIVSIQEGQESVQRYRLKAYSKLNFGNKFCVINILVSINFLRNLIDELLVV